ncbi:MAG: DUF1302 domain-containing protein [Alphaproteobacteria bacterium]|nr:DUF1302 domain-containing protein [Alphaproteobacteria bacterium]
MWNVLEPGTAGPPSRWETVSRPVRGSLVLAAGALALTGLLQALPAQAVEFGVGELRGSLDTTVSHGVTVRVGKRSDVLAAGANDNDGNLNYDRGVVSNTSKFTSDLDVEIGNFGAFARVTGFFDFENENNERERTPLSDDAKDLVGKDIEVLDLYATGAFDVGGAALDLRLGRHVLNWGESTFIQNGINAINPFDVSRLRTPGSELREALLPVSMFSAAVAPTDTLSVEGFYQLDWEKTEIDPVGSYFSVTDYVGPGATRAVIPIEGVTDEGSGFGLITPAINDDLAGFGLNVPGVGLFPMPQPLQPDFDAGFLNVMRASDRDPADSGQWGVALRHFAEELNNTEFGFYFINYHSRLPIVSATTSTAVGVQAGLFAAQAVTAPGSHTIGALSGAITPLVTEAVTQGVRQQITNAVAAAVPPGAPNREAVIQQQVSARLTMPATRQQIGAEVRRQVAAQVESQIGNIARGLALDRYVKGDGHYFIEYPEDIQLFGLSFNTLLGASGWALQGEYSFRPDTPLQRAERALFADGLAPILRVLDPTRPDYIPPQNVPAYLGSYAPHRVQGYVERDVSQAQATATKVFGPTFGADSMAFVTEVAVMHVHGMPDKNATPLESPAGGKLVDADADADATSWGYRLAARLDYNNAIGAANLFPYLQFGHDVGGNSPAPVGSFVEGRTALTLGLRADYLNRWEAGIGYTRYGGKGTERSDRDFVSASVRYSF